MAAENQQVETLELGLKDAVLQAWKRCVGITIPLIGRIEVCLEIDASPSGQITITLEVGIGSHKWKWSVPIDGNKCIKIAVVPRLAVEICVSNWNVESHTVSFRLQVYAIVTIPIYGEKKFPIIDQTVTLPLPLAEEVEGFESLSAEDSLLTLALLGTEVEELPAEPAPPTGATVVAPIGVA
jgi:hypothetical protein